MLAPCALGRIDWMQLDGQGQLVQECRSVEFCRRRCADSVDPHLVQTGVSVLTAVRSAAVIYSSASCVQYPNVSYDAVSYFNPCAQPHSKMVIDDFK